MYVLVSGLGTMFRSGSSAIMATKGQREKFTKMGDDVRHGVKSDRESGDGVS